MFYHITPFIKKSEKIYEKECIILNKLGDPRSLVEHVTFTLTCRSYKHIHHLSIQGDVRKCKYILPLLPSFSKDSGDRGPTIFYNLPDDTLRSIDEKVPNVFEKDLIHWYGGQDGGFGMTQMLRELHDALMDDCQIIIKIVGGPIVGVYIDANPKRISLLF